MTKLQLLHRALNERMMAAVEQIMEMVGGTVQEYEEETMRVRKENEVLKRRLQWMEETNRAEWPGPNEPGRLYTQDELNPSQQEACAVSFEFGQESQGIVIKTESTDHSLYVSSVSGLATLPQSTDEGSAIAGTSASFNYGQRERMTWHSTQSYMEPLEFDPTPSSTVRCKTVRGKRQRMSFACPDCGKVFGREQGLLFHMRTHSTERPYAYRKRKACFYGDRIRKRKLHGLSMLSRERSDDHLDGSEQANVGSPLAEHSDQEQEPDNLSSNSDQANEDEGPPKAPLIPVQRKGGVTKKKPRCPICRQKFKRRSDLDLHLKSHVEAKQAVLSGPEEQKKKGTRRTRKAKDAVQSLFPCPKCDRVFPRSFGLYCHMRTHGVPPKNLKSKPLKKKVPDQTEQTEKETRRLTRKCKKSYPCPHCDKVFLVKGWLKPHVRVQHCEIKTSSHFEVDPCIGRTRSQKMVTKKFMVKKGMQGFGSYHCPSCNKAYSSMAWLSRHMSYHQGENPAALEQQSKTDDRESNEGNTNEKHSRENAPEESSEEKTMDIFETIETSQTQSALQADAIGNVEIKHCSLQPKVVLKPLMPVCMYESTVPSVDAHSSGSSESCSFNLVQTSSSASVNNKSVEASSGQSNQNNLEIVGVQVGLPENDSQSGFINQEPFIELDDEPEQSVTQTCTTASLKLTDSELITLAENAPKEPGGNNHQCEDISAEELTFNNQITVSESENVFDLGLVFSQDEDDIDDVPNETVVLDDNHSSECLPNDSQSEVEKQMPVTTIEDEAEQSVTQVSTIASMNLTGPELMTYPEKTPGESEETKNDCLTVEICNEKLTTLVISDDKDGMNDAPSPSKGFDDIHSSVCHPNGPQILNPETESMNADDVTCSLIDKVSQKTHVEDGSMSQGKSSETSQSTFGCDASLSQQVQVDKNLLDSKNDSGSHGPNTGSRVNIQKCSSLNSSFRSRWRKKLRDNSESRERVRCCLNKSEKGPFPDVPLNRVSQEQQQELYQKSAQRDGTPSPHPRENAPEESAGEETTDRLENIKTSQAQSALQVPETEQPVSAATCNKSVQNNQSESVSICNLSLQPRIVLKPLSIPQRTYWSTTPNVDDFKSGSSERCSFNPAQTSSSASVNNAMEEETVMDKQTVMEEQTMVNCSEPVVSCGHSNQNEVETIYSVIPETDIVSVTVDLPKKDFRSGFINQEPFIVIDDETEESVTQTNTTASLKLIGSELITTAENAPKEPGGTKLLISAEELTVKKRSTVSESVFNKTTCGVTKKDCSPEVFDLDLVFSDDEDDMDDAPSKVFNEKETIALDDNRSSKCLPNDSRSALKKQVPLIVIDDEPEPLVTEASTIASLKLTSSELMTAAENPPGESGETKRNCKEIEICNPKSTNLVISDGKDAMKDASSPFTGSDEKKTVLLDENHSCVWHLNGSQINANDATCSHIKSIDNTSQKTDSICAGQASLLQHMQVDKKLLNIQNDTGDDGPNMGSSVNTQILKSHGDDSEKSEISGTTDPSVKYVKTNESFVKGLEDFDITSNSLITSQSSEGSCKNPESSTEQEKVDSLYGGRACEAHSESDSPALSVFEPSRSSELDSCNSDAPKTNYPETEEHPVFNIDSNAPQQGLDVESTSPLIPDPCQSAAINPSHLESVVASIPNTNRSTASPNAQAVEILEPLIQDKERRDVDQSLIISDSGSDVLQGSSGEHRDQPQPDRNIDDSCVSNISCSDIKQIIDQVSDCCFHGTGFCEEPYISLRPEERFSSGAVSSDSSSSQNLESKSTHSSSLMGNKDLAGDVTPQTQGLDVERSLFIGSGRCDVKPSTNPDSCNTDHTHSAQPDRIESPGPITDPDSCNTDHTHSAQPDRIESPVPITDPDSCNTDQSCNAQPDRIESPGPITDPDSCNTDQSYVGPLERVESPDPDNQLSAYSELNPNLQDIKPRALGQIFYPKSNDFHLREDSCIVAEEDSDEAVEAQRISATLVTGKHKRKRVEQNISLKESSKKCQVDSPFYFF